MRFFKNKLFIALTTVAVVLLSAVVIIGISTNGFTFVKSEATVEKIADTISKNQVLQEENIVDLQLTQDVKESDNENVIDNTKNNITVNKSAYSGKVSVESIANATANKIRCQYHYMDLEAINNNIGDTLGVDEKVNDTIKNYLVSFATNYYDRETGKFYRYNIETKTETEYDAISSGNIIRNLYNFYFDTGRIVSEKDGIKTVMWSVMTARLDKFGAPKIIRTNLVYMETIDDQGNVLSHSVNGGYNVDGSKEYPSIVDGSLSKVDPTGIYSILNNDEKLKITKSLLKTIVGDDGFKDLVEALNNDDGGLLYTGFVADLDNGVFTTGVNAPFQRNAGFTAIYDTGAQVCMMTFDTFRLKFEYGGLKWMLQPWKGQYGVLCGAEVGFYYTRDEEAEDKYGKYGNYGVTDFLTNSDLVKKVATWPQKFGNKDEDYTTIYSCSEDPYLLTMSYDLYRSKEAVISMKPREHWWLTAFRMGDLTDPSTLTIDAYMKFENSNGNLYDAYVKDFNALYGGNKDAKIALEKYYDSKTKTYKIRYTKDFFNTFVISILNSNKDASIEFLRNSRLLDALGAKTDDQVYLSVYEINFDERSIRFIWGNPNNISDASIEKWSKYSGFITKENGKVKVQQAYTVINTKGEASDEVLAAINSIYPDHVTTKTH